jgi:uncharacterized protein (DUF924 family)
MTEIGDVLHYWFDEAGPQKWFEGGPSFDAEVRQRLGALHDRAAAGDLDGWAATPDGALALLILLDQVPRNIFRGTPQSFATDAQARTIARRALEAGFDLDVPPERRIFFYLPLQHSEDPADQRDSERLTEERIGDAEQGAYARRHREIIERFGRFPHRNAILGRVSTPEELAFLTEPNSSF